MNFENGFTQVDFTIFLTFVKSNNLIPKEDCMNTNYLNEKGQIEAIRQHGFAYDIYFIKSEKEYSTLEFVTQLINGKG